MIRVWVNTLLVAIALTVGSAWLVWQGKQSASTRRSVDRWRQDLIDVPRENARLKAIIASRNREDAVQHVRAEIEQAERQLAVWEQRIQQMPLPRKTVQHFSDNRDPEKGPVRLEYFSNKGQATPSTAFQTAVWALIRGNDEATVPLFAVSAAGREKLLSLLAPMSPESRARYHPPEKRLGMLLARDILREEGLEIGATSRPKASGQVTLAVYRVRDGRRNKLEKQYPFQLGPAGWQLAIADNLIDGIPAFLTQSSMFVPPRHGR